MVLMPVRCLYCHNDQVTKRGKTATGKQRYRCHNPECPHQSFLLDPAYKGRLPAIKQQVIEMSLNASGVRDTARVLQISTRTVLNELKKKGCTRIRPALRADVAEVVERVDEVSVIEIYQHGLQGPPWTKLAAV
jgi:transposase-like protein